MASQNQLSRYGSISRSLPYLAPSAKVFFVGDSDDTSYGVVNLAADFPVDGDGVARVYTTIQAAVNAASAGRGDVVLVAPGYDHTLGRADTWATAGVKVIGFGEGGDRPAIRYGATTDVIDIAANNVTIENLRFIADVDSVETAVEFDTGFSGHTFRGNQFDFNATADNFVRMLHVGSSRNLIEGNEFLTEDTLGGGAAISFDGGYGDYTTVRDNYFWGLWDTNGDTTAGSACISVDIGHDSGDTVLNGLLIKGNTIVSRDTAAAVVFNLAGGATTVFGLATDNRIASYDTATADTAQVLFGNAMATQNWFIDADSDTPEELIGVATKFTGVQSS